METKAFYVISALQPDSSPIGRLNRYKTKKEAVERAKEVIRIRQSNGEREIPFYICKVDTYVGPQATPIVVKNLK